jgi:hypothetical protein
MSGNERVHLSAQVGVAAARLIQVITAGGRVALQGGVKQLLDALPIERRCHASLVSRGLGLRQYAPAAVHARHCTAVEGKAPPVILPDINLLIHGYNRQSGFPRRRSPVVGNAAT